MKNILIVKLSAIGDVIHALPVSFAIKEAWPEAHITWVVEPPARPLLECNPCVDEIITFHKKEFRTFGGFLKNFGPLRRQLKAREYDAVLDLQGLFKSAAVAFLAKAPVKLGMCNMREGSGYVSKPVLGPNAQGHIVERYLDVARALGCPVREVRFPLSVPERDASRLAWLFQQEGADLSRPYVALAVGANWPNKRWPEEHFARLADDLSGAGLVPVLAGGGPVDEERAARILGLANVPPVNLVGKTSLPQLAALMQRATAVVGGDTGPVHLAAGLGTKTIMLMGPTDANRNGPYGQMENAIEVDHPCRGCWKRSCPKGLDCLAVITPDMVKERLRLCDSNNFSMISSRI